MTREEAIKQLKENRVLCINSETEPFAIAYNMAIKALEQESVLEASVLEAENKTLRIKLENAEDVLRGLKEDLADARAELRERW